MLHQWARLPTALMIGFFASPAFAEVKTVPSDIIIGALDEMIFVSSIEVNQNGKPFDDRFIFKDGMFFSEECQNVCSFGWSDYHTRIEADGFSFVIDTACSDAPHSVRWEGRVVGDHIEGTMLWKAKRFYRTLEWHGIFSGKLTPVKIDQAIVVKE